MVEVFRVGQELLVYTRSNRVETRPAVTGLKNGGFAVAWEADNIRAQLYSANGAKQGVDFRVDTLTVNPITGRPETGTGQIPAKLTGLINGKFVVTWTDVSFTDQSGYNIYAQILNSSGVRQGGEFQINTEVAGDQSVPSITSLSDGGFVVTWQDLSRTLGDNDGVSIKAQVFNAGGLKRGSEVLVNTQTADSQYYPTVTGLENGGFIIT